MNAHGSISIPDALTVSPSVPLGLYVHVPFCATRCGYCDFNTYTPGELGVTGSGSSTESPVAQWFAAVEQELQMAAQMSPSRPLSTIFVGGGTPSLLGADGLARVMEMIGARFDLTSDAEVTTEANPESTSAEFFAGVLAAGFTRISLGMQSAAPHVLATLDRTHTPGRAIAAAREAAIAGFAHVNLDLIYGTPGESNDDLRASLDAVLAAGVDHVSAYALIVEDGTALARRVRRGELPAPDDDVLADRYEMIDNVLQRNGFHWYEVSNWSRTEQARCRHNEAYWNSTDWWGIGPGAHSHVGGVRWWNHKQPKRYAQSLADGQLPIAGSEALTTVEMHTERVMLAMRRVDGLPADELSTDERKRLPDLVSRGLLDERALSDGDAVALSSRGRLLADGVIAELLELG